MISIFTNVECAHSALEHQFRATLNLELAPAQKYSICVPQTGKEAAKHKFVVFLESKKLRMTSQRQAIIDTVFSTDKHFTAEELLVWARERDKSVSRATVYRTLPLLTESGFVREMDFGKDYKFYDPNYADHPHHSHLICGDCEKIVEFEDEKLDKLENEITAKLGFRIKSQRLQITGTCEEMKRHGTCKNKCS
jgi:Fur family ferric uptake transcriptional regulator